MPRSKPQDTRRRLASAQKHISTASMLIKECLPTQAPIEEWEARYQFLGIIALALDDVITGLKNILGSDGGGKVSEED